MTFAYPPVLLALLVPLLWVVRGWTTSARRTNLLLKAVAISTIIVALAQPVLTLPGTKTGVVVLVDTSLSVTDADLRHASSLIDQMHHTQGRNWMKVVPFAAETRNLLAPETSGGLRPPAANLR